MPKEKAEAVIMQPHALVTDALATNLCYQCVVILMPLRFRAGADLPYRVRIA